MKITDRLIAVFITSSILLSCTTSAYITDPESIHLQKEMRKYRTGMNFAEAGLMMASSIGEAFTGIAIYPESQSQSFRKFVLFNQSKDTLYINMVTDQIWKDSTYCDIRDIVMPPLQSAKVIVPMGAAYNVFFRNDYNAPDDEKVEVNTAQVRKVKLSPMIKEKQDSLSNR